MLKIQ